MKQGESMQDSSACIDFLRRDCYNGAEEAVIC